MAGKGDSYRPVNRAKYDENFDAIFRKPASTGESSPSPVWDAPFDWGEEEYETRAEVENAISQYCVAELNSRVSLGAVRGPNGEEYNIQITAKLIPVEE